MNKRVEKKGGRLSALLRCGLICGATVILLFALIYFSIAPEQYDLHVGQPATITIYAPKDVEDTVTTEAKRQAAADAVEPSYKSADHSVNAQVLEDLGNQTQLLLGLREEFLADSGGEITEETLSAFNRRSPVELTQDMLAGLFDASGEELSALSDACAAGVRDTLNSTLPEGQESAAVTRISRDLLAENYPSGAVAAFAELIRATIQPNMLIDTEITEENRQKARDAVEPEMLVKREVIVREGEIVTEAQYQMIDSLGLLKSNTVDLPLLGGLALLVLALCALICVFLRLLSPGILKDARKLLLLCLILVLEVAISLLVRGVNSYLMPVALAAMLITTLLGAKTALFVNAALSFIVSLLVSADGLFSMQMFAIMLIAFAAGPVAGLVLSRKQLRSGVLLAGFAVAMCNFLLTLAVGLVASTNLREAAMSALWAMGGGVFSAVLAIGLQALLEWLFNLATNAKLIELSNPNQPLLRRLLMEASGTYHHSIIVANLAEAAAEAVGGNGLLARVGAYYHDVGKLKRPMYFKENQIGADNPHDRADPRVSAAILTAHPRDGAQMAQKEKLPPEVVDIIRQHHGDGVAIYFYDKASKLYGDDVDASSFRYEGPRPRTKEAAVVMLADTIEAATRTLSNPSPERMEQLIRKLIREKLADGQLNEAPLTFKDLDRIVSTFCTVLTGVFHERIEYPDVQAPPRQGEAVSAEDKPQAGEPAGSDKPDASGKPNAAGGQAGAEAGNPAQDSGEATPAEPAGEDASESYVPETEDEDAD